MLGGLDAPVAISPMDVALGWLRHSENARDLREWAQVVHGAIGLIDLAFDQSAESQTLIDLLWRVSFGERASPEMDALVRAVVVHAEERHG